MKLQNNTEDKRGSETDESGGKELPPFEVMYRAFNQKDTTFEGIFFTAVRTTGIFCRPGCSAKKPKKENVEFFATTREAILHGYRPCKICCPMENTRDTPFYIRDLLKEVQKTPQCRFHDGDLRERGIDPANLRRWFKKHHGITFQAYLRSLRINRAYARLSQGDKVTEVALESGYESLSGFSDSFKKLLGSAPRNSGENGIIELSKIQTPLGPMFAGITGGGLCLLEFADRPMLETQLKIIAKRFNGAFLTGTDALFDLLEKEADEYFRGERRVFSIPLNTSGTPFQERVWKSLRQIPYGETRSYRDQAIMIGSPDSVRAVARANGENRISIIIPCHRVVGSDGTLTGYGGGLWRKKFLLDLEGAKARP